MASNLTHPPSQPVIWHCVHKPSASGCLVLAQTWFAARKEAARIIGAPQEEIECQIEVREEK